MQQEFPGQHTTATTVTVGTTTVNPTIRFDINFLKTRMGLLKIGEMLMSLIGFICIATTHYTYTGKGGWFNTVAMGGFWYTFIMLLFYLFHFVEKFHKIPWLKVEFIFCAAWALCNFIACAVVATDAGRDSSIGAAVFFSLVAMVLFGMDAWLKFMADKRGELAQGERHIDKTISTTISPAY